MSFLRSRSSFGYSRSLLSGQNLSCGRVVMDCPVLKALQALVLSSQMADASVSEGSRWDGVRELTQLSGVSRKPSRVPVRKTLQVVTGVSLMCSKQISSSFLQVVIGRRTNTSRGQRQCQQLAMHAVGDERHFVLECPAMQLIRNRSPVLYGPATTIMHMLTWQSGILGHFIRHWCYIPVGVHARIQHGFIM